MVFRRNFYCVVGVGSQKHTYDIYYLARNKLSTTNYDVAE